ncbi:MAG: hypothetical protein IIC64_03625 [SAR324 cluster bacterium]|nr:hypothetical protein [SAR324 cluster bacterium]
MSWNDLTFVECSLLTASQMTQLQGNFAALGAGMSGSPALSVNSIIWSGQGSGAALHVSSGIAAPQVSSLGTLHVSSGLILSQVASLGTVHAASGFVAPEASSFGMVHTASGFLGAETSSFGTVEVASAVHIAGAPSGSPAADTLYKDNICKGWINFNGKGTIAIRDSFNVASITDDGIGVYTVTWDTDFADANYAVSVVSANTSGQGAIAFIHDDPPTAGAVKVHTTNHSAADQDSDRVSITAFGGQ